MSEQSSVFVPERALEQSAPVRIPAVPPAVKFILGLAAPMAFGAAQVVPYPGGWVLAIISVACALGGGVAVQVPTWLAGRPILRGSFPAVLGPLAALLVQHSGAASDSVERGASLLGAIVLAGLAGVALPQPTREVPLPGR